MHEEMASEGLDDILFSEADLERNYDGAYNRFIKPIMGRTLAFIAAFILLPIFAVIAVAIIAETGFPILYRAPRGGYKGKPFHIIKFRSMVQDADRIGGGTTALNDRRITKVGAFLRKTKLDEITQLFNIIMGNMCFIGPRPELLQYTEQYTGLERHILDVRPGITDFSSLSLINLEEIVGEQNADEMYEKYVLKRKNWMRLQYVAELSFATDCKLFISTVWHVLKKASE